MKNTTRREFIRNTARGALGAAAFGLAGGFGPLAATGSATGNAPPNILFAIADDWSWPHASILDAPEINTPAFDRVARDGCLFTSAYCAAPQCSPNRAATFTGRHIWQLEEAGTHASIFPDKFPVFTDLLENAGYHVGFTGKGWAPGNWGRGGRKRNPAGPAYNDVMLDMPPTMSIMGTDYAGNFKEFLSDRPDGAPFFFWFGCHEPHRPYEPHSGRRKRGKDPDKVIVPPFLPDVTETQNDILDYFLEVEWFDSQLYRMLKMLHEKGELDNTIVIATSDNGMPFPRAKANLYDYGLHVPLAVRWPGGAAPGRRVGTPVSFIDFAPTILDAAGVDIPESVTGRSFLPLLGDEAAPGSTAREYVLAGRERHGHARYDNLGYPSRSIFDGKYLYIHNFKPDRWPAGDPDFYYDIDESPTKSYMIARRDEDPVLFEMAFGKRPERELYLVIEDPGCVKNLAGTPAHSAAGKFLEEKLMKLLAEQGDPRATGRGDIFESFPRVSHMHPELGGFAEQGEYNQKYMVK